MSDPAFPEFIQADSESVSQFLHVTKVGDYIIHTVAANGGKFQRAHG